LKTILSTESRAPFVISLAYEIDDSGDADREKADSRGHHSNKREKAKCTADSPWPCDVLYPQTPTQMMKTLAKKAAIFASDG
jgi:hypothetical protein